MPSQAAQSPYIRNGRFSLQLRYCAQDVLKNAAIIAPVQLKIACWQCLLQHALGAHHPTRNS